MLDMKEFGLKLRQIREDKKITRKNILEVHGITIETLRKLEKGLVIPKLQTLQVLSIAYHTDVIQLFNQFKSKNILVNAHDIVDQILIEHANTVDALDDYKISVDTLKGINTFDPLEVAQFNDLCTYLPICNSDTKESLKQAVEGLEASIRLRHPSFSMDHLTGTTYSYIELRLLLLMGIALDHIDAHEDSIKVFLLIESQLDINEYSTSMSKKLYVKLLINLAYTYHKIDDNEAVIDISNKCIHFLNKYDSNYYMETVLYRKAIAEHLLGKDTSKIFTHIRAIMEVKELNHKLDLYRKITRKKYNIIF